jgi:hypothetical protein
MSERLKSTRMRNYPMRWLLLFLILASSTWALPSSPTVPTDPFPSSITLFVTAPLNNTVVNATTSVSYQHTAPTILNCTLNITGWPISSTLVTAAYSTTVNLTNGSHRMIVRCANTTLNLTTEVNFTIVNESRPAVSIPVITIIYPTATAKTNFNLTYQHNGPTSATCMVSVNGTFIVDKTRTVAPSTPQLELMTRPEGTYLLGVNCSTSAWNASTTFKVNVTNAAPSGGLSVTNPVYRGGKVIISGTFGGYQEVKFSIKDPAGNITRLSEISGSNGFAKVEYTFTTRLGNYTVNATDEEGKTLNGTFSVLARIATIKLGHNLTNITSGAAFTVHGWQFVPNDAVTVKISGTSLSEKRFTDSNGEFDFYYADPLAPKVYTISAQSVADPLLTASTTLTVFADTSPPIVQTPTPVTNPTPGTPLPVITPPVNGGTTVPKNNDPGTSEPEDPLSPREESPEPIPASSSMPWKWILIPLLFLLVIGGILGYLVHNGTLDISSFGAMQTSLKDLFDGNLTEKQRTNTPLFTAAKPSTGEEATIKDFISGERGKGFDDLTIRSALLAKGWDKGEVDRIFDELYKS